MKLGEKIKKPKNKKILDPKVWHPYLLAGFPVWWLYVHNFREVEIKQVVLPLVIIEGVSLIVLLIGGWMWRDWQKAGLVASGLLVWWWWYGFVAELVRGSDFGNWWRSGYVVAPVMGGILVGGAIWIIKKDLGINSWTKWLNVMSVVLIVSGVSRIGWQLWLRKGEIKVETMIVNQAGKQARLKPDIYYIILDRYGSQGVLEKGYKFDNSEFMNYLKNKGFYVADQSTANYLKTGPSLASSLNMEYINYLESQLGAESDNLLPLYRKLHDYKVWRLLKNQGYTFIHAGSFWEHTSHNEYADINYNLYPLPEFTMLVYKNSLLYPVGVRWSLFDDRKLQWQRVQYIFGKLQKVPEMKQPTFVFAHILVPHDPYVFDAEGRYMDKEQENGESYRDGYVGQVRYVNGQIKKLVENLIKDSETPPVIVIQGDEGYFPERYVERQKLGLDDFDWTKATDEELKEKMGILNVYYVSEAAKKLLYKEITPVNSFRIIFKSYFGEQMELLPDKNYIHADDLHPYKFSEVTDKLKNN